MQQPIIFIGMHRSGTSMLGRLLENLGLFVGTKKESNNESLFFLRLNEWLMAQCGARWDMPQATQHLWDKNELLAWIEDYIRYSLSSPRAIQFMGLYRYLTMGGIIQMNQPWGWKDPRNTYTLPLWLRIFPEAKVLYIERHGVDVAQSLRVRNRERYAYNIGKYRKYRPIFSLFPKQGGFFVSPRCTSLEGGFSLWEEYTNQATEVIKQLPGSRIYKVRYEDFLKDPVTKIRACAEFCGLNVANQNLESLGAGINADRAYSYLSDPELLDFASDHKGALVDRGYK